MIPDPSVVSAHGRSEPDGSERYASGNPVGPISAARSDPPDRKPSANRRSGPSNRGGSLPDRDSDRSDGEDESPDEGRFLDADRSPDETESIDDEIARLEAEIERRDRHLRYVIERYERLLEEKDRRLSEERTEASDDVWSAVRSTVARLLPGDR